MAEIVVRRRARRIAARKASPARFAGDASAVPDAGRRDASRDLHLEEVRDSLWASGRDFPLVTAEPEHLVLLARQRVRAQQPLDERPMAVSRKGPQAAPVQTCVPQALRALQQAHADEWKPQEAHSLPVKRASWPVARLLVDEPASSGRLELWPRALRARSALPLARQEPQARSVSLRLALRRLAAAPQAPLVSSARLSPLLPSPRFPLWQPLPLALLLRRRPESFCALFPQHPRGSSSNASSFP
jgi:hypothetical protein